MKIIKRKLKPEISKTICDVCGKQAVSWFKITFGYGSEFDLEYIEGDFCNEHGKEFRSFLLEKYKFKPKNYGL